MTFVSALQIIVTAFFSGIGFSLGAWLIGRHVIKRFEVKDKK